MSPKARQSKGQARVTAYEKLLSQEMEERREDLEIYIPPGPRLGDIVFEFDKVTKVATATACCWIISPPTSHPARSWAWSVPTAPARPPC